MDAEAHKLLSASCLAGPSASLYMLQLACLQQGTLMPAASIACCHDDVLSMEEPVPVPSLHGEHIFFNRSGAATTRLKMGSDRNVSTQRMQTCL